MQSPLHKKRLKYIPKVPDILSEGVFQEICEKHSIPDEVKAHFPNTHNRSSYVLKKGKGEKKALKIGVFFSGGQAAGGHNVITGLFDAGAHLIGFLGGPSGLIENQFREILNVDEYRNQGGFDLIGSGRTKIETEEQLEKSLQTVEKHHLDGLVIIGGDDSNTNAAVLAEYFVQKQCQTKIVGIPKTIDGDLRSKDIEISFGFDSACKTFSELIGNIARDALSSRKYFHFIRLMGRSASHVALECALQTRPNLTLISEEKKELAHIVSEIADLVCKRSEIGKEYGVILVPEGLIESIPGWEKQLQGVELKKDPHGNIQISQIETEKLLIDLVKEELKKRNFSGNFHPLTHFFGYEGRSCLPSNFDANYCYALGKSAFLAIRDNLTGVICAVQNMKQSAAFWQIKAVPIVQLMQIENRLGKNKPVIQKKLVDIKGDVFIKFSQLKADWALSDSYRHPGPIQFFGDEEITDSTPLIL